MKKCQDYGTEWYETYFYAVQYEETLWSGDQVWRYDYGYGENLFTSEYYYYENSYDYANDIRYYQYSGYEPDDGYAYEGYDYYYEPDDYRYSEGLYTETRDNGGSYSYQYLNSRVYPNGEGFRWSEENSYDSSIQQTYYRTDYDEYSENGYNTYDYYYYEYALTDSDEKDAYWRLYTRDGETNQQLTYESYSYNLESDTGNEYWYYSKNDYTGDYTTYYSESHEVNLFTGAYWDSEYFEESGRYYTWTEEGQNLDAYFLETEYYSYIDNYYYESEYMFLLASGNQTFDARYQDYDAMFWEDLELLYLDDHWTGKKLTYDYSGPGVYDMYLYTSYPDDYFLIENFTF
jgi:hypothetical protein